jgi:hypothetical protein
MLSWDKVCVGEVFNSAAECYNGIDFRKGAVNIVAPYDIVISELICPKGSFHGEFAIEAFFPSGNCFTYKIGDPITTKIMLQCNCRGTVLYNVIAARRKEKRHEQSTARYV